MERERKNKLQGRSGVGICACGDGFGMKVDSLGSLERSGNRQINCGDGVGLIALTSIPLLECLPLHSVQVKVSLFKGTARLVSAISDEGSHQPILN